MRLLVLLILVSFWVYATPNPRSSMSGKKFKDQRDADKVNKKIKEAIDAAPPSLTDHDDELFMNDKDKKNIIKECKKLKKTLKGKANEAKKRATVLVSRVSTGKRANKNKKTKKSDAQIVREAMDDMDETNKAVAAVVKANGFEECLHLIDLDGTLEGDIFTTAVDARVIQAQAEEKMKRKNKKNTKGRKKRSVIFFPYDLPKKWTSPIHYIFEDGLAEENKAVVRSALDHIEDAIGCIQFIHYAQGIPEGIPYIFYATIGDDAPLETYGYAYIGKQTDLINGVYLDWKWKYVFGTAIHETLHVLGVGHQHNRANRNSFIYFDKSNLRLELLNQIVMYNYYTFSSLGSPYGLDSIMHYGPTSLSSDKTKKSLLARNGKHDSMGQRLKLSQADISTVKRAYCCPEDECSDTNVLCAGWKFFYGCTRPYASFMTKSCQLSCELCQECKKDGNNRNVCKKHSCLD